jgi:type II secretory pathway pseudopilin PulG
MAPADDRSGTPFVVIVIALAGLLSTLGAAALSGYWTNASVQRQFKLQRNAQIQDQRRQVYVDYLGTVTAVCAPSDTNSKDKTKKDQVALLNAYNRARLIATPEVREPLTKFTEAIFDVGCGDKLDPFGTAFLDAARQELDQAR